MFGKDESFDDDQSPFAQLEEDYQDVAARRWCLTCVKNNSDRKGKRIDPPPCQYASVCVLNDDGRPRQENYVVHTSYIHSSGTGVAIGKDLKRRRLQSCTTATLTYKNGILERFLDEEENPDLPPVTYRDGVKIPVLVTSVSGCTHCIYAVIANGGLRPSTELVVQEVRARDTTTDDDQLGERDARRHEKISKLFPDASKSVKITLAAEEKKKEVGKAARALGKLHQRSAPSCSQDRSHAVEVSGRQTKELYPHQSHHDTDREECGEEHEGDDDSDDSNIDEDGFRARAPLGNQVSSTPMKSAYQNLTPRRSSRKNEKEEQNPNSLSARETAEKSGGHEAAVDADVVHPEGRNESPEFCDFCEPPPSPPVQTIQSDTVGQASSDLFPSFPPVIAETLATAGDHYSVADNAEDFGNASESQEQPNVLEQLLKTSKIDLQSTRARILEFSRLAVVEETEKNRVLSSLEQLLGAVSGDDSPHLKAKVEVVLGHLTSFLDRSNVRLREAASQNQALEHHVAALRHTLSLQMKLEQDIKDLIGSRGLRDVFEADSFRAGDNRNEPSETVPGWILRFVEDTRAEELESLDQDGLSDFISYVKETLPAEGVAIPWPKPLLDLRDRYRGKCGRKIPYHLRNAPNLEQFVTTVVDAKNSEVVYVYVGHGVWWPKTLFATIFGQFLAIPYANKNHLQLMAEVTGLVKAYLEEEFSETGILNVYMLHLNPLAEKQVKVLRDVLVMMAVHWNRWRIKHKKSPIPHEIHKKMIEAVVAQLGKICATRRQKALKGNGAKKIPKARSCYNLHNAANFFLPLEVDPEDEYAKAIMQIGELDEEYRRIGLQIPVPGKVHPKVPKEWNRRSAMAGKKRGGGRPENSDGVSATRKCADCRDVGEEDLDDPDPTGPLNVNLPNIRRSGLLEEDSSMDIPEQDPNFQARREVLSGRHPAVGRDRNDSFPKDSNASLAARKSKAGNPGTRGLRRTCKNVGQPKVTTPEEKRTQPSREASRKCRNPSDADADDEVSDQEDDNTQHLDDEDYIPEELEETRPPSGKRPRVSLPPPMREVRTRNSPVPNKVTNSDNPLRPPPMRDDLSIVSALAATSSRPQRVHIDGKWYSSETAAHGELSAQLAAVFIYDGKLDVTRLTRAVTAIVAKEKTKAVVIREEKERRLQRLKHKPRIAGPNNQK